MRGIDIHQLRRSRRLPGAAVMLAAVIMLDACVPVTVPPPAEPDRPPAIEPAPGALRHVIDPAQSELRLFVYRDGSLAHLGHNHVISSTNLGGEVWLGREPEESVLQVRLPLESLEVDRPDMRAEAGEDFPGELDAAAIEGTRNNMLGERLLNADGYPVIYMTSRRVTGTLPALRIEFSVRVRGRDFPLHVPVSVDMRDGRIVADATFSLDQTALGLEPYSVMLGALAVRDRVDARVHIVAVERR